MTDEAYDVVTYVHWLHWRLRCLEGPPESFERLFQEVSIRARDQFVRVRPYGRIGDRKVDGLYWGKDTAYQVYSPDQMKESETRQKIESDLSGAIKHWGKRLRRWVFVYNVRRGVPPDVVRLLQEQQDKYPDVCIDFLSSEDLWKVVRALPVQDRIEILGPPPGFEHLFPLGAVLPEEIRERIQSGRFVVVQDIISPINIQDAIDALAPARPFGPPLFIRPSFPNDSWQLAADFQKSIIDDALVRCRDKLPRFAVFSLSPIPLAIHLGFVLSDRVEVEPFQYHRDQKTWRWAEPAGGVDLAFDISGVPAAPLREAIEISIRVSLSAEIQKADVRAATGELPVEIEFRVGMPDVSWLVSAEQLQALGAGFRGILAALRHVVPNAALLHLFYAGPTGGAIVVGQAINPRMNPPVALYEYDRQQKPRYRHVLTLHG